MQPRSSMPCGVRSSLLSSSPPRCFSVNDQLNLPRGRHHPGANLTDDAPAEVDNQRQVTITVVPQGPPIRVDGEMVPSTWRWRMECGYCDHVEEVSMPHGLKTRSMGFYGDSILNHVKSHWVLSESETTALATEGSEPVS